MDSPYSLTHSIVFDLSIFKQLRFCIGGSLAQLTAPFVHATAIVDSGAIIEHGASVWHFCHIRSSAILRQRVSLGRDVYVDVGVELGEGTHVQNGVSIYAGVNVGKWCFIGPHVIFTNDNNPRSGNKTWTKVNTNLENGSSIGAGAIIRCGVTIGAYAMVGAGAIVTKDVPPFQLVLGFPARPVNYVCACGQTLTPIDAEKPVYVQECCAELMHPDSFALAKNIAMTLPPAKTPS